MACSKTKRLAHKICPLYRITKKSKLCCYEATVNSKAEAEAVIADAKTRPDYVKQSQIYEIPNNMFLVYLYFRKH